MDTFITKRLVHLGLTVREFARRVDISHVFVVRVKKEHALFPVDQFEKWSSALELNREDQELFLRLAVIEQASPIIQAYIARLESQIIKVKK